MKVKAQIAMVLNLDKCLGCHTCSVTCKNTWTNRAGAEYMWFNNVETKPGVGYPKGWEDQSHYQGGWKLDEKHKLTLKAGDKLKKIATGSIFYNQDLPELDDYYEPWTYDYKTLFGREQEHQPVARAKSQITGETMDLNWGPNWDDDLAGGKHSLAADPNMSKLGRDIKAQFEQTFMMYLPRLCEHCLNPTCVASCPSGAIYKREEDGIVLVNQDACRGWRMCVSGCPYKKVYFNWKTHKAEKCTFCYPRVEEGLPTVCSETCVGRIRYIGVLLYDADEVAKQASEIHEDQLYERQLSIFLNPFDAAVIQAAKEAGISDEYLEYAQNSPVYQLAVKEKLAFPLHPEFRTMPMVWYMPPLSPIINYLDEQPKDMSALFPEVEEMRIPIKYLAAMLSGGNITVIQQALAKMLTMRRYMRYLSTDQSISSEELTAGGLTEESAKALYRLLAVAKYDERFVIPKAHKEEMIPDPEAVHGRLREDESDSRMSKRHASMLEKAQNGKSGAELYEEAFYGGIWRDQ